MTADDRMGLKRDETGTLAVYTGPMYAGKTTALIDTLETYDTYTAFKPDVDDRYGDRIATHNGEDCEAYAVDTTAGIVSVLRQQSDEEPDAIGIDEAQFFNDTLPETVNALLDRGYDVVVAGRDRDFKREPFTVVSHLVDEADRGAFYYADCEECGDRARYTQRLVDGEPPERDDSVIRVEDMEDEITHEPRCEVHHVVRYRR